MNNTTLSVVIAFLVVYLQFLPTAIAVGIAVTPLAMLLAKIQLISRHTKK